MKPTGVVRRIDELGRIVIPKEIRKTLRLSEGENLEIYINSNNEIVLKKYSLVKSVTDISQKITDSVNFYLNKCTFICDRTGIVAASGKCKKDILNKKMSKELIQIMRERGTVLQKEPAELSICDGVKYTTKFAAMTVLCGGDIEGMIVIMDDNDISELELRTLSICTLFLGKYLEQ